LDDLDITLDAEPMVVEPPTPSPSPAPVTPSPAPALVVEDAPEDRYSRLRLIPWWDQECLRQSHVLVVGAGALGNELVKNLGLLGVGHIVIIDFDRIENSNLTRSVLFRAEDEGRSKAAVAAERIMSINPDVTAVALEANIGAVGLGVFRAMDVVLGGLDNREARLAINQACWRVGRPWVDGAIEVLHGVARVFVPPLSACYECTMNSLDYRLLAWRKSCALLTRNDMLQGKVPTTPTTASVVAGIQTQEAVKLVHNRRELPVLAGRGFFFNGLNHDSYTIVYDRKEDCLSHDTYEQVQEMPWSAETTTVREALETARAELGKEAVLEFDREVVWGFQCQSCNRREDVFKLLVDVSAAAAECPHCGKPRTPELMHAVDGSESFLDRTLAQIGIPRFDIVTGRVSLNRRHYELTADRAAVLGAAA
jgi:molybdopterin/thiamine biosynthesis adenylyltransferase